MEDIIISQNKKEIILEKRGKKTKISKSLIRKNKKIKIYDKINYEENSVYNEIKTAKGTFYLYTDANKNLFITKDIKDMMNIYLKTRLLYISRNKNYISLWILVYIHKKRKGKVQFHGADLKLGERKISTINGIKIYTQKRSKRQKLLGVLKLLKRVKIPIEEISRDLKINNAIKISIKINNIEILFPIRVKQRVKTSRENYLPIKPYIFNDYVVFFRSNDNKTLVLVKRPLEEVEKTFRFKFFENKIISVFIYSLAMLYRTFIFKKISLYYEKFAGKADEGCWEVFKKIRDANDRTKNFFVISKDSEDYERLKNEEGIVIKFSFPYYIYLYASHNIITTDAQLHVNVLRCKNRALKKSLLRKKFVFLQHGIIYLKNLGKNGIFQKDKEGDPDVFVVSSNKEKDIVKKSLKIKDENIALTGIPVFDTIKYGNINQRSDDIITIMLTWKPYEEHLDSLEDSSYYKNAIAIYEILIKFVNPKNIKIIPHPKVKDKLLLTNSRENICEEKISKVLSETKLLITDYSSVCYNSFYQGAGVLFYQSDLKQYEKQNGKLIPRDKEYIGYRCFDEYDLMIHLNNGIKDKGVDLEYFRTEKFINNYSLINEFHDGKNVERIYEELTKRKII